MAESVVVIPLDGWGHAVARLIAGARDDVVVARDASLAPAARLAVVVLAGPTADDARLDLEAHAVPHLAVERDEHSVWVGPTVLPGHAGCHRCSRARRRQHTDALLRGPDPVAADDPELWRHGARAALAVIRRVLAAPESEAGVTRRFVPGVPAPLAGRVVPVWGCPRCDPLTPLAAGWSVRTGGVTATA